MKDKFIENLNEDQKQALKEHFNTIYECEELSEHEYKIAYLGWLWANGKVYDEGDWSLSFDEEEAGISPSEYDITFEDDYRTGGYNLQFTYDYYSLAQLIEKMQW